MIIAIFLCSWRLDIELTSDPSAKVEVSSTIRRTLNG
jgi:hypothetical protein